MRPPASPDKCPKCGAESPCTDWNEVDIGIGVQTFDHRFTCPAHGEYAYEARSAEDIADWNHKPRVVFRDEEGK